MKLSIIIPAHNEEKRISKTLEDYAFFFRKKFKKEFEIIVVLNGCIDNTLGVVKKFQKKYPSIRYLDFKQSGKGFAIIEGFKTAKGDLMGFADADGSTNAEAFNDLILKINPYDGIIASRYMKGSVVNPKQPIKRRIASRIFNFIVRVLFGLKTGDTQCGAKLFRKEAIKKMLPKLGITKWAFDVDLLYQIKRESFRTKEIPTVWKDCLGSRLNIRKATIEMFLSLARLRLIYSPFKFIVRFYDLFSNSMKIHGRMK